MKVSKSKLATTKNFLEKFEEKRNSLTRNFGSEKLDKCT
jgi:hypothetical protein